MSATGSRAPSSSSHRQRVSASSRGVAASTSLSVASSNRGGGGGGAGAAFLPFFFCFGARRPRAFWSGSPAVRCSVRAPMVILTLSVASVSTMTDAAAAAAILRLCIRRRGCTLKALAVASSNTLHINACQIAARRRVLRPALDSHAHTNVPTQQRRSVRAY